METMWPSPRTRSGWSSLANRRARARSRARTDAPTLRTSRGISHHRLDIGTHDGPGAGLLCIAPELIRRAFALPDSFAQPFHCHVDTDLVAIPEAVHDGARRIGNGKFARVNRVPLDALGHGPSAEPDKPDGRVADCRLPCRAFDSHPHRGRHLQREPMELQSGDEADDASGHKSGGLGEDMGCVHRSVRKLVEPARGANDLATADQARQRLGVDVLGNEILQTKHSLRPEKAESAFLLGNGHVTFPLLYAIIAKVLSHSEKNIRATSSAHRRAAPHELGSRRLPTCFRVLVASALVQNTTSIST